MTPDLPTTRTLLEQGRSEETHLGGQLFVSLHGETRADFAFGDIRPNEEMSPDHLLLWMSSSKPVTAVAIAGLWERGLLDLDDPVARHIPEFAANGKQTITLRHLLTHTGGIRTLRVGWPRKSWQEVLQQICDMKLEPRWDIGRKAGYHTASSWFVLGEIVQRLAGEDFATHIRRTVFEPLAMDDCWIGMPVETYRAEHRRISPMWDTDASPREELGWTDMPHATRANPAANGIGPMRQLGRFYQMMLRGGELDGTRLLTPQTVDALTARHRVGLYDHTFRQKLDMGLGFVIDSRHYGEEIPAYGYGEFTSSRVFGHSGYRSSTAFADPVHQLVVALAVNGLPSAQTHRTRFHQLTSAIYRDLGLAT